MANAAGRVARVARGGGASTAARVLDRGACGPLADRNAAAAARRELAGHLLDAALLLRIGVDVGGHHHGCCLLELVRVLMQVPLVSVAVSSAGSGVVRW